jgi:hypothetical protein
MVLRVAVVMVCALFGAAFADPPTARLARALAARTTPVFRLPARPVTSIGHCMVDVGSRPPGTFDRVRAEFLARKPGWRVEPMTIDLELGVLGIVLEPSDGEVDAPIVSVTDDQAVGLAIDFLAENYELFGLPASYLAQVHADPGVQRDDRTLISRTVHLWGDLPPSSVARRGPVRPTWDAYFDLNRAGTLRRATIVADDLLPPATLCAGPRLAVGDPKLTAQVIGAPLPYATISGEQLDAGPVAATQILSTRLTIHRQVQDGRTTLRLAYAIVVGKVHRSWTFIVDADTGLRLDLYPNFVS